MQVTPEVKRMILCDNYARYAGIDVEAAKARIANDTFSKARARGDVRPYSYPEGGND